MAEYASIPIRINGSPEPEVTDVSIQQTRAMKQVGTAGGRVQIIYGPPKYQITITFATMANKRQFMTRVGANQRQPPPHDLGFDLGLDSYSALTGIPSGYTATTNNDGDASLQFTLMYEDFVEE